MKFDWLSQTLDEESEHKLIVAELKKHIKECQKFGSLPKEIPVEAEVINFSVWRKSVISRDSHYKKIINTIISNELKNEVSKNPFNKNKLDLTEKYEIEYFIFSMCKLDQIGREKKVALALLKLATDFDDRKSETLRYEINRILNK